jgi:perosamine synthetase
MNTGLSGNFYFLKGRLALYAILKSLALNPGDEVVLPGFTCVVVPNAVMHLKLKPVYVDIEPSNFNISVSQLEGAIGPRTRVIIAQHTFGVPADMDPIMEIARRKGLYIIEDSCHALGAEYMGKMTGEFGDAAFFSSQWSKPVTTGLGGWAAINNPALRKRMDEVYREFRPSGAGESLLLLAQYVAFAALFRPSLFWHIRDLYRKASDMGLAVGSSSRAELEYRMPPFFERKMAAWQTSLLKKKLSRKEEYIAQRVKSTRLLKDIFETRQIPFLRLPERFEPVFLRYPVLVDEKNSLLSEARKKRIELGDWFLSPLHPNLSGWEMAGYRAGMCPVAEETSRRIVNVPLHAGIGEKEMEKTAGLLAGRVYA